MAKNDEHTLNTALAGCLRDKSPAWKPPGAVTSESLDSLEGGGRPDILVTPADTPPVVVETEVEPARTVEKDAEERLERRLKSTGTPIRYAVAVRLPDELRDAPESDLPYHVARARAQYAVLSSDASSAGSATTAGAVPLPSRFPRQGWIKGGVDDLAGLVENLAVSEQAIAKSTDILEKAIRHAAGRLGELRHARPVVRDRIGDLLHQDPGVQTDRMAMAIVANACTFHNGVAGTPEARHIRNLDALRAGSGVVPKSHILAEWAAILDINYWPIFAIARDILVEIPSGVAARILGGLARAADGLEAEGVTRSHDLTGRMFQKLIQDRKFLATFYTRPEAATLLAELAMGMLDADWDDPEAMTRVRVGDLACGTGTLLLAAYHALIARCRRAGGDDATLHRRMIEDCLIGADIMPAAAHLTASMLSSVHPGVSYDRTQIYTLPYGKDPRVARLCLGSLSLLESEAMPSLYGTGLAGGMTELGGRTEIGVSEGEPTSSAFALANESLDLVIMNPPFTRPTNHETTDEAVPSFAGFGTTTSEQNQMSTELKRLRTVVSKQRRGTGDAPPASNGNAGLASNFIDLAHAKLRPGGILAMVLPQALALGGAWKSSRHLIARHYRDCLVLSLAGARSEEKSFSADTGMAEVLVIARKRSVSDPDPKRSQRTKSTWITLRHGPRSSAEAHEVARAIRRKLVATGSKGPFDVAVGQDRAGVGIHAHLADGGCAGLADLSLAAAVLGIRQSRLPLPRAEGSQLLPIAELDQLGTRGRVHRDVGGPSSGPIQARGPFTIVPLSGAPTFPVLWSHDARRERRLFVEPDSMGDVRTGRHSDAATVWKTASHLHFNLDFRLNSQSLAACLTPDRAIGGRAWPSFQPTDSSWEEPLAAWANTTLGLILFWWTGTTQQSGRTNLTVTRLPDLPVLDMRKLTPTQISDLTAAAHTIAPKEFLPAHRAAEDPVRKELDRLVLEDAFGFSTDAMDQVALLRRKWCAEPTVHGGKSDRLTP